MGDERLQWKRAFFRDLLAGSPFGQSRAYFAQLIVSIKPCDGTKS
jgi:hypothetical protein